MASLSQFIPTPRQYFHYRHLPDPFKLIIQRHIASDSDTVIKQDKSRERLLSSGIFH
jgi:hypothetical protein